MADRAATIKNALLLLREHYGKDAADVLKALQELPADELETELLRRTAPDVPASICNTALTPYQALVQYYDEHGYSGEEIAQLLGRTTSSVNATRKKAHSKQQALPTTGPTIPLATLDTALSPGEAIVAALRAQGHTNKEVADILGKDPRNTWKIHERAKEKQEGGAP